MHDPDEAAKALRHIIEADMTLAEHRDHGHTHIEIQCLFCSKTSLIAIRRMTAEQLSLTLAEYERQLR